MQLILMAALFFSSANKLMALSPVAIPHLASTGNFLDAVGNPFFDRKKRIYGFWQSGTTEVDESGTTVGMVHNNIYKGTSTGSGVALAIDVPTEKLIWSFGYQSTSSEAELSQDVDIYSGTAGARIVGDSTSKTTEFLLGFQICVPVNDTMVVGARFGNVEVKNQRSLNTTTDYNSVLESFGYSDYQTANTGKSTQSYYDLIFGFRRNLDDISIGLQISPAVSSVTNYDQDYQDTESKVGHGLIKQAGIGFKAKENISLGVDILVGDSDKESLYAAKTQNSFSLEWLLREMILFRSRYETAAVSELETTETTVGATTENSILVDVSLVGYPFEATLGWSQITYTYETRDTSPLTSMEIQQFHIQAGMNF